MGGTRPSRFTPVKSELLLRLLIADLVGEAATRESILALRDDIADLFARVDEAEASARGLPHRRKYLLLVTAFLRGLLELHLRARRRGRARARRGEGAAPDSGRR